MVLRGLALAVSLCASVTVAACGFSEVGGLDAPGDGGAGAGSGAGSSGGGNGSGAAAGGSGGSSGSGAGSDGAAPSGVPVCNPPACPLPAPPAGWELVLYGTSRADACPMGFDSADTIESPVAGADACACAACVTTGTSCSTGAIATRADNGGGGCGTNAATLDANNGNCQSLNANFGQDALIVPPAAVRGTCTAAATPVLAKVTTQSRRICTRQASTCAAGACAAPTSMKACIAAAGDVACPSGTKHLLGTGLTATCPSCGCSITSATCGGQMDFYAQSNCQGTATTLVANVCKLTNGASIQSAKWKPVVQSEQCATTPVAPTTTLTATQTVCCP